MRVPGAAQHLKGVHARLRGLWWCAADTDLGFTRDRRPYARKSGKPDLRGPLRSVAAPDQRCTAPLRFALHRIRDTWLKWQQPEKKSAPAAAGARRSKWWIRASVAKTRGVGHLFPMGQALRDDLGRLQRRLAQ